MTEEDKKLITRNLNLAIIMLDTNELQAIKLIIETADILRSECGENC